MTNENEKSPWELEHGRPQRDAEEFNSDAAKKDIEQHEPGAAEKSSWELETGWESDRLYSPNITPDVPKHECKDYILHAVKEAIHMSNSIAGVHKLVKDWNQNNDPRVLPLDLFNLIDWGLKTWSNELGKYRR